MASTAGDNLAHYVMTAAPAIPKAQLSLVAQALKAHSQQHVCCYCRINSNSGLNRLTSASMLAKFACWCVWCTNMLVTALCWQTKLCDGVCCANVTLVSQSLMLYCSPYYYCFIFPGTSLTVASCSCRVYQICARYTTCQAVLMAACQNLETMQQYAEAPSLCVPCR